MNEEPTQTQEPGNMIVVWDWENTAKGMREKGYTEKDYDLLAGFDGLKKWWGTIGKVIRVFILSPMHKIYGFDKVFQDQEFSIVLCPKIPNVVSPGVVEYEDTTDASLITLGEFCINYIPSIRYLCLGSGDAHFAPLIEHAQSKGIKMAAIIGNEMQMSWQIDPLIDNHPTTGKKMVHLFSPTKSPALNRG